MTDGIIQEVFSTAYLCHGNITRDFSIIELETIKEQLIEKIKQELPCLDIGISKTLIGDNQECL